MEIIQNIGKKQSKRCEDLLPYMEVATKMWYLCFQPLGNHTGAKAIAHCQVDQKNPQRFFVMKDGSIIVNPVIKKLLGKPKRKSEGCMSFADNHQCGVMRHKKIVVDFYAYAVGSDTFEMEHFTDVVIRDDLAFIFQHEIDHMNGVHIF